MGLDIYVCRYKNKNSTELASKYYIQMSHYFNKIYSILKKKEEILLNKGLTDSEWSNIFFEKNNKCKTDYNDDSVPAFPEKCQKVYNELKKKYEDNKGVDIEDLYMRKENWFLAYIHSRHDFGEDCYHCEITKDDVIELISRMEKILKAVKSSKEEGDKLAAELLPTQSGFFFGSTDYDNYYYDALQHYLERYKDYLNIIDWDNEYIEYTESW